MENEYNENVGTVERPISVEEANDLGVTINQD